ncbi:MAG: hypothetical protein AAFR38_14910 [Planctomycetota bacterium]
MRAERERSIVPASAIPPPSATPVNGNPFAPSIWFYDWSRSSPLDAAGVASWLAARLRGVLLPADWLAARARDEDAAPSPWDFDDPETAALHDAFTRMGARRRWRPTGHRS